jgi:hypothetical protein
MLPTVARGELASTLSVTALLVALADTTGSGEAFELGPVGLPPPHACRMDPRAPAAAASVAPPWQAAAQNWRRVRVVSVICSLSVRDGALQSVRVSESANK